MLIRITSGERHIGISSATWLADGILGSPFIKRRTITDMVAIADEEGLVESGSEEEEEDEEVEVGDDDAAPEDEFEDGELAAAMEDAIKG